MTQFMPKAPKPRLNWEIILVLAAVGAFWWLVLIAHKAMNP